ncbi:MAG: YdcF family protein [Oscillospiraceae bacterium]|nr:YdcF family protein [Oscillospiraceae bacterium]
MWGRNTKNNNIGKPNLRHRLIITIALAVIMAIVVGISFAMMRLRIADMHIIFPLVLGMSAIVIIFMTLWTLGASNRFVRFAKIMRRICIIGLAAGFTVFLVFLGLTISGAHTQEADIDALIVLGAGLRNDAPSLVLQTRLEAAIAYLETREDVPIIVSGGLGLGQNISEAEAMFRYLRARGIDENLIWKEDASTSTYENLNFSRALMEARGIDIENATVAVVSNEFHLFRATHIARNVGICAVGVAAETPGLSLRALYFFREAFALAAQILL